MIGSQTRPLHSLSVQHFIAILSALPLKLPVHPTRSAKSSHLRIWRNGRCGKPSLCPGQERAPSTTIVWQASPTVFIAPLPDWSPELMTPLEEPWPNALKTAGPGRGIQPAPLFTGGLVFAQRRLRHRRLRGPARTAPQQRPVRRTERLPRCPSRIPFFRSPPECRKMATPTGRLVRRVIDLQLFTINPIEL